jgi:hypothetical protein
MFSLTARIVSDDGEPMKQLLALALAFAAAGVVPAGAIAAQPPPYELVDLATPYATFWGESQALATPDRVAAFKARFEELLPGFFTAQRVGWMTEAQYDDSIARSFAKFPEIRARYTAATSGFAQLLSPAHARFTKAFRDLRPVGTIYLIHSLGEFDGGTRAVAGVNHLVFGADVIAQVHDFPDEQPFFHHELFHVYHSQFFSECEQMWCALWTEGLAVAAAQHLNPHASDAELLLGSPRPIRPEVDRNRTAAVCQVAARLNSADPADYSALFSDGPAGNELPPRFGYYVGYLVAKEAARKRPIRVLAHLDNAAARDVVTAALGRLATCGSLSP